MFYFSGPCDLYYKHTMIENYAYSIVNKLEALHTDDARVVIYDRHVFIVQATGPVPATVLNIVAKRVLGSNLLNFFNEKFGEYRPKVRRQSKFEQKHFRPKKK